VSDIDRINRGRIGGDIAAVIMLKIGAPKAIVLLPRLCPSEKNADLTPSATD
jgi:hypothetical protein